MFDYAFPFSRSGGEEQETAYLISYEQYQFGWAEDTLLDGSIEEAAEETGKVLAVTRDDSPWKVGETLSLYPDGKGGQAEIAGILGSSPFDSANGEQILICSEETFRAITGKNGYTIVDVQLKRRGGEDAALQMRDLALEQGLTLSLIHI